MTTLVRRSVDLLPLAVRKRIKDAGAISRVQRWLVKRYLDGSTFEHTVTAGPASGVRFRITLPDDKAIWTGTYEQSLAIMLRAAVRPGWTCFDIGAHHGYMTAVFAKAGAGRVYAFEPNPANLSVLSRLAAMNASLPIVALPYAIGDEEGETSFSLMRDTSMGKLAGSRFQQGRQPSGAIVAQIRKIDALVASGEILPPDLIKIDVEGGEADALRGASEILESRAPKVFIEVHTHALLEECETVLRPLGYAVRDVSNDLEADKWPRHMAAERE